MSRYYVVFRTSSTQDQTSEPFLCTSRSDAIRIATEFNRFNQDTTWNAVNAYVETMDE